MSLGHLRITTLDGSVIYEGEGTLHLEGRGPLGGLPPEAVVQPLQVEVARPDGMHFAADLTAVLPCVPHEIRVDFPTVSAPLAVPDGWGIDVLTDIPDLGQPEYTLTLDLDGSTAGWLRGMLTLTPEERASVRQAQDAVREALVSRRTFREAMMAPRQPRGLDGLTMQQVMDLHRSLAPYGENVTPEDLREVALRRPDLAAAICDAFDIPAGLLLGQMEREPGRLTFEDDPPRYAEATRYDDLIDSTRREFVPDPHNYTTPRTNAMSWSPPADGEKVPRCP